MKTLVETAWGFNMQPTPIPVPFSMSYPPDWYYQMHYTAVNSPWKWLGPFGGADVFQSPPSLAVSKALEPLFSFSSSFLCSSKGLAAAERLGGRGGAEGGGGGCNWRLEPCYPSRCPHQPISILSAVQSRRSIRKTRPLTSILILYGLCECEKVFHVAWVSVQDYLLDLVLSLIWSQHQTVIFRLGMCCRQAIRPSCPSLALTAVFVCDMQMSPFFFFLFWVEVSAECRQRRLLTLTVKWASLCKSIGCSAGQRFI